MRSKTLVLLSVAFLLGFPVPAFAHIEGNTDYKLDLTKAEVAAKKAKWSTPNLISVTQEGLGWGTPKDEGVQDFWLETEAIGIGLSWRPTTNATVSVKLDPALGAGNLFVRYSADSKHWTAWQFMQLSVQAKKDATLIFEATLGVPARERAEYNGRVWSYWKRMDVPWAGDEEALVREILMKEPKYFEKCTPFIGYVQFLYETHLWGGERVKGLDVWVGWWVSGLRIPPNDKNAEKGRDVPWRAKAP